MFIIINIPKNMIIIKTGGPLGGGNYSISSLADYHQLISQDPLDLDSLDSEKAELDPVQRIQAVANRLFPLQPTEARGQSQV